VQEKDQALPAVVGLEAMAAAVKAQPLSAHLQSQTTPCQPGC
jgi:hypothetical protein